ncbi:MAG: histidine kinase [Candidatus Kapabacteria bacterium]|jgi:PAS domain S-box-containing protein|nr:histidine kinase [Candidatus Kapabacteria bacterium]
MNYSEMTKVQLINELEDLDKKHQFSISARNEKTSQLSERVKELNCLFKISVLTEELTEFSNKVFDDIVMLIPGAFQFPEITSAKIKVYDYECFSENYEESFWSIKAGIKLGKEQIGQITVYYAEEKPESFVGPFLKEEFKLINAIAEYIARISQRTDADKKLLEARNFNAAIIAGAQEGIIVCDADLRYKVWNLYMEKITGLKADQVLGKIDTVMFAHVSEFEVDKLLKRALKGETVQSKPTPFYIKETGKKGWYTGSYTPLLSSEGEIIGVVGTISDITSYTDARKKLEKSQEKLRAFTGHLQSSREDERISIAREIHDEFGQMLTALKINLSLLDREVKKETETINKDFLFEESVEMHRIIDIAIKKTRELVTKLRPEVLDNLGLIEAIEWHSQKFFKQTGINLSLNNNLDDDTAELLKQDKDRAIAIFRIFQESLTNVIRHAKAKAVWVKLGLTDNGIVLEVKDDGKGMKNKQSAKGKSFGLLGMKERTLVFNGELEIESELGKGTTVRARIPIEQETA